MADTHETHAEITAEMRFHGQQNIDAEKDKPEYGILTMEGRIALNNADRLEAAHKREVEELKRQIGDCAKLREALVRVRDFADRIVEDRGLALAIINTCDAATAAPPRNCDVYSADELKAIFKRELVSELPMANEHEKNLVTITAMRMIDTLFATTKEGENDENE